MTQNSSQPLQTTIDHARKLTAAGQATTVTPHWVAQAHHVGDLSVLALALRR
jgi:hypothetical protein